MRQYQITNKGELNKSQGQYPLPQNSNWWLILSPEELMLQKDVLKVTNKVIKECVEQVDLPKLEVYDHYDFGLVHIIDRTGSKTLKHRVNFHLSGTALILIVNENLPWLNSFEEELLSSEDGGYSPEKILYLLLDRLTSEEWRVLDCVENDINHLEDSVLNGEKKDYIKEIIGLRKKLLHLKRDYESLIDIASGLEENDNELFDPKVTRYYRILNNRLNRLNMRLLNLRENITQIREAYDAQIDIGLNKIMKVFTVITVVFSPLTVIVGWYGMNFNDMPELGWRYGYFYVTGLSILSIVACLIYFKKKDWL